MLDRTTIFFASLVALAFYAGRHGGGTERMVAIIFIASFTATVADLHLFSNHYRHIQRGLLAIDILMFLALLFVAVASRRLWPIPMASMMLVDLASHFPAAFLSGDARWAYQAAEQSWSYLMTLLLLGATALCQGRSRRGIQRPSWLPFWSRWLERHRMTWLAD